MKHSNLAETCISLEKRRDRYFIYGEDHFTGLNSQIIPWIKFHSKGFDIQQAEAYLRQLENSFAKIQAEKLKDPDDDYWRQSYIYIENAVKKQKQKVRTLEKADEDEAFQLS